MRWNDLQLLNPLDTNAHWARYRALAPTGELVEVRVFHERNLDSLRADGWLKRLRLAAMVDHPAIRPLITVEIDSVPSFFVLPWMTMNSLADQQRRHPLAAAESLRQACRLAEGISAAHRFGLFHGRIEPRSILVDSQGDWLVDLVDEAGTTDLHAAIHAPGLAGAELDGFASDVSALGAILRWLLPNPGSCEALLDKIQAIDPSDRPTAAELVSLLQAFADGNPLSNRALQGPQGTRQLAPPPLNQTVELPDSLVMPPSISSRIEPDVRQRLGPYELLERLGEGGMGTVYRAQDLGDGRAVAVKVLRAIASRNTEARRRFAKEARMLAQANNPYVANLLAFSDDEGVEYLAVEFVPGGNLGSWLEQRFQFDESAALALGADAAKGLMFAHQRGIVHRDIKPDNLLLTQYGVEYLKQSPSLRSTPVYPLVKLADFGLARFEAQSESLAITRDGMVLGTPFYMSPEQCRGTTTDARSDIYSLGATLFHLLAGHPPFDAESHVAVMNKHCHEPIPSLRKVRPELSEAVEQMINRCLSKNPDARYAHAGELLDDLTNLCHGSPTSIVLHPQLPDLHEADVMTFEFAWDLAASPSQLWPYVSHTDRLNQAMGLPSVRVTIQNDPLLGVRRFAETKVAGQLLKWEEHPYEWIEGRRMSVLRHFTQGPFHWFINLVELQPGPTGGTRLKQTFRLRPRNFIGRWIARFELGRKSGKALGRIYQQVDRYVASNGHRDPSSDAFRKPAVLSTQRRLRLEQGLGRLRASRLDPLVVDTLGQFLAHASDQEVARIRPYAFASRFQLDPKQTVATFLWGAREGILVMLWDILCPSCRIPADVQETLAALKQHGHCDACNVDFELDFGNSIELIFRAHPEIRSVETRTYCVGGPAFSSHVVAQTRLEAGERFEMELALEEGAYRLRGPQLPFVTDLRVTARGTVGRWQLALSRPPSRDMVPELKPGAQVFSLVNDSPRDLLVRLERTASVSDALTAGQASSMALFREMFPGQVLSRGQIVGVASITLLLAQAHAAGELYRRLGDAAAFEAVGDQLGRIQSAVSRFGGCIVKTIVDGVVGSFHEPVAAVRAAVELLTEASDSGAASPLQVAVHRGPAMVTTLNDRIDYFGASVHLAHQLLTRADANTLLITDAVGAIPEVSTLLRERGEVDVLPSPGDAVIIQRWRPRPRRV